MIEGRTDRTARVILLVGLKGAGKTTIGELLERRMGIDFLRVEPIYLSVLKANPHASPLDLERVGFGAILDAVELRISRRPVVCLETTGTAGCFPEVLRRLKALCRLYLVRVTASEEACSSRVARRDGKNHIPVSDERVREINQAATKVRLAWGLEIDNSGKLEADLLVDAVSRMLSVNGGAMASSDTWKAPDIVPSITYADVPRAVRWLERVFGFRERAEARLTWPGGGMAWMEVGDSLFSISTHDDMWGQAADPEAASGMVMKVYVEDVDGHFARAKAEGARIILEPQDGFWGGRIYRALDHEGHRWEISQRGHDLAADRWQTPPGVVRGAAR